MLYHSTRGGCEPLSASEAILQGLAPDGGLYVPQKFPQIDAQSLSCMVSRNFSEIALSILSPYLEDLGEELSDIINDSYNPGRFEDGEPAPVTKLDHATHLLELYHGPTLAFKDIALQILPRLMTAAMRKAGRAEKVLILAATSGDTGKAALEGFMDVDGTRIAVVYPRDGVSPAQRRQMVTQPGGNVWVRAIAGNFDDAQTQVKRIMSDPNFLSSAEQSGWRLSSANSINIGRLLPQIVYYFHAYARLAERKEISIGEKVDFVVPTGNFGNILAGYYAKAMGLPVGTLICASNRNHVLTDFFHTGSYTARRPFYTTSSPSMDILISSNLERLLFEYSARDPRQVQSWMNDLKSSGKYDAANYSSAMRQDIWAGYADESSTAEAIFHTYNQFHRLVDPHTAVALSVLEQYRDQNQSSRKAVVISTASPYKFSQNVLSALHQDCPEDDLEANRILRDLTGVPIPEVLTKLECLPERHTLCHAPEELGTQLLNWLQED